MQYCHFSRRITQQTGKPPSKGVTRKRILPFPCATQKRRENTRDSKWARFSFKAEGFPLGMGFLSSRTPNPIIQCECSRPNYGAGSLQTGGRSCGLLISMLSLHCFLELLEKHPTPWLGSKRFPATHRGAGPNGGCRHMLNVWVL